MPTRRRRATQGAPHRCRLTRALDIEPLEARMLLAADSEVPAVVDGVATAATEAQPDLVAFAQAIADSNAKFYGAAWCPHCTAQKALLEDGAQFLPFIEVTNPDRTRNAIGDAEMIEVYPTWENGAGDRHLGAFDTLEELSAFTGVSIPVSNTPSLAPIEDVTLQRGSPLHIPLDGFDPDGGPLNYTVTSSNEALISTTVLQGNRSMRITAGTYGDMVFQLFEGRAPRATSQIIELAESGDYDGVTFHRIIDGFVIQGGDITNGDGTGGSRLGDFDDQFHPDLQHNRTGVLSMAKGGDDTNDSQFFITEGPTPDLDFNHTIFGQLVEGEAVREAVSNVPTTGPNGNPQDQPLRDVAMESVEIFVDQENGIVMLKALGGAQSEGGTADITVTVTDEDGNSAERTFRVTIGPDTTDAYPFLTELPSEFETTQDNSFQFQLEAIDLEGDELFFASAPLEDHTLDVDNETGLATLTPAEGFIGTFDILVGVRTQSPVGSRDPWDTQSVAVVVRPAAPLGVDLLAVSDSGPTDNDNVTLAETLEFEISGTIDGATVTLLSDGVEIGQSDASGTTTNISVAGLPEGRHRVTAVQTIDTTQSNASAVLEVTVDRQAPVFTSTPITVATADQVYVYDADAEDQLAGGVAYQLALGPDGMIVDPATGVVQWTPKNSQSTDVEVVVTATDAAGNATDQSWNLAVNRPPEILSITPENVAEGDTLTVDVDAIDPNGGLDTLTFSLDQGPAGAAIDPATGLFVWTPAETDGGQIIDVTVRVTDSGGLFATRAFSFSVIENNSPPVFASVDRQLVQIGQTLDLALTATDADDPVQQVRYRLGSEAPSGVEIDALTGRLTWTPLEEQSGEFAFDVIASDSADPPGETSLRLDIDVNDAPHIDQIGDKTIAEGQTLSFEINGMDAIPSGGELTFEFVSGNPSGSRLNRIDRDTVEFVWTPGESQAPSTYAVTVRATDQPGTSATQTFTIRATETNRPPQIADIEDRVVATGGVVDFVATASDPDRPTQQVTFALLGTTPPGASIDPVSGRFQWTADEPGSFDFTVQVTDDADSPISETTTFTVHVDGPPQIVPITAQEIDEGSLLEVAVQADDPTSGESLSFALEPGFPAGASIDPATGLFRWIPAEADGPGAYDVTVRVVDNRGLADTQSFSIEVKEVGRPPEMEAIGDQEVTSGRTLSLRAVAIDTDIPDHQIVYNLEPGAPADAQLDPNTGQFEWTPPSGTVGTFEITIRAAEVGNAGLSSTETFRVRVSGGVTDDSFGFFLAARSQNLPNASFSSTRTVDGPIGPRTDPRVLNAPVNPETTASSQIVVPLISPPSLLSRGAETLRSEGAAGGDVRVIQQQMARNRRNNESSSEDPSGDVTPASSESTEEDGTTEEPIEIDLLDGRSGANTEIPGELVDEAIADIVTEWNR